MDSATVRNPAVRRQRHGIRGTFQRKTDSILVHRDMSFQPMPTRARPQSRCAAALPVVLASKPW